ncbi:MAG: iron chelate uptake ABC transporter family permease subunit [Gammaproteobacteria bacterium]|nr:iron chelate uptake ABC transporter family permease subunit [Gammaproteobacteria bacterium]
MASTPEHTGVHASRRRPALLLLGLFFFAVLAFVFALTQGSMHFSLADYIAVLHGQPTEFTSQVIHQLRLPRAQQAFITGALLASAGALLQVLLRNPLAEPYVLGISGGASVFALLAMLAGLAGLAVSGAAFAGALLAMLLVFGLARGEHSWSPTRLLLTGVVLATGWGAIVSFLLSIAPQAQLHSLLFWLMGDLSFAQQRWPGLLTLLIALVLMLYKARSLNVLAFGGKQAQALGVEVTRLSWQIYVLASLMTAVAVVEAGSIGFVGLIVPHVLRLLGLHDHRFLIPGCMLAGGGLLLVADTLARSLFTDIVLPVGVLTAALGVPVFIVLLYRGTRSL